MPETEFLDLNVDVLFRILEEVTPGDLASCAQTCSSLNNFIKDNKPLFRVHYIKNYDDPRQNPTDKEPNWISEIQNLVKCEKILNSGNLDVKRESFRFVNNTVTSLIHSASETSGHSRNVEFLSTLFDIPGNLDAFLLKSTLYSRSATMYHEAASTEEDRQLSAKNHVLYGIPNTSTGRRALKRHPFARSSVYDLRNYTDLTGWGPYQNDGTMNVDWEMVEAIMVVLAYNSGLCCRRFLTRFRPPWLDPFDGVVRERDQTAQLPEWKWDMLSQTDIPLVKRDPFGVEGIWSRVVCFLDYNDLYQFNFSKSAMRVEPDKPREPLVAEEAIRHIYMRIRVTEITEPGPDDHPSYPIVYFAGMSRAVDTDWDPHSSSKIRGNVRMTKEGEVRWTTISLMHGEERWRSEGIQVGGIGSRRGVMGTWFDKDFDPHGPAGPTAFWKVSDGIETDENDSEFDDWGSE